MIRYLSNIAPPSRAWLLSSDIAMMGARRSASASEESNTLVRPWCRLQRDRELVELIDKAGTHKGAISSTSAFEQQAFRAKFAIESIQDERQAKLGFARED